MPNNMVTVIYVDRFCFKNFPLTAEPVNRFMANLANHQTKTSQKLTEPICLAQFRLILLVLVGSLTVLIVVTIFTLPFVIN
jgi:hypothetical protein